MAQPHGLVGKQYAPTFALLGALILNAVLGLIVWNYTTSGWLAVAAMALVGIVIFIGLFGEAHEN